MAWVGESIAPGSVFVLRVLPAMAIGAVVLISQLRDERAERERLEREVKQLQQELEQLRTRGIWITEHHYRLPSSEEWSRAVNR